MLYFHGIEYINGSATKFSKIYNLARPVNELFDLLKKYNGSLDKCLKKIGTRINHLCSDDKTREKSAEEIALCLRVKDLIRFLSEYENHSGIILKTLKILSGRGEIEMKWHQLESVLSSGRSTLFVTSPEVELANDKSFANRLLKLIGLFFLEQDEERPPANLILKFVPGNFPDFRLVTTDREDAAESLSWTPKNLYCRTDYLGGSLLKKTLAEASQVSARRENMIHFPRGESPEREVETEVAIEHEDERSGDYQLLIMPMNPAVGIIEFMKRIQKKLGVEGILHFFGVIRQLCSSQKNEVFAFDLESHLKLFHPNLENDRKPGSLKHYEIAIQLLNEMEKLNIVRRTKASDKEYREIRKKLFVPYQTESETGTKENGRKFECIREKHYIADHFFYPSERNPFHFGMALKLIPPKFFGANYKNNQMTPFLIAYIYNNLLNDYQNAGGTMTRMAEDIITECGVEIAKSAKYRSIYRLKNALHFMAENHYIDNFQLDISSAKNPWKDEYRIVATEDTRQKIAMIHERSGLKALAQA